MSIKTRVKKLEGGSQVVPPFDIFSVYPGLMLPVDVREAVKSHMCNETDEGFLELLATYPEHMDIIKSFMLDLSL